MDILKLKYWISKRGYTQNDVAVMLDINYSTWNRKCNGVSDFTRTEINKIKNFLELPVSEVEEIFFN